MVVLCAMKGVKDLDSQDGHFDMYRYSDTQDAFHGNARKPVPDHSVDRSAYKGLKRSQGDGSFPSRWLQ